MTLALDKVTADAAAAALQHCSTAARLVTLQPRHRGRDGDLGRQLQAAQQMDLAPLISGIRVMLQIFTKLNVMYVDIVFHNTFLNSDLFCLNVEFIWLL